MKNNNNIIPKLVKKNNKIKYMPTIKNTELRNMETGEIENITTIEKIIPMDFNFHKIWIEDLLNILNSFGNRKITILSHLLKIMRNEDNSMNFTMRSLSEDTGISQQTCQTTITELIAGDVIKRDKSVKQLYYFNPALIVRGSADKRQRLLVEYYFEDQNKDIKNTKKLKAVIDDKIDQDYEHPNQGKLPL